MTAALVPEVLGRLLPDDADVEWQPLSGGLNVRSFLVTAGARRFVLRLPLPGAPALVDLRSEARAMRAAAAAGLAPPVVAVDEASSALLTHYAADARPWDAAAVHEPRNVERAAALLRALHAVDVDAPPYSAVGIAERYAGSLREARGRHSRARALEEPDWARELDRLAARYDMRHTPEVLCHNDLAAANILDDGRRLKLIDFEYAVRSAPILDLAGLVAMNDYSAAESRALTTAYYGETGTRFGEPELASVVRMIRLMSFFWARIGEHVARDPEPYVELAAAVAERLRADASAE